MQIDLAGMPRWEFLQSLSRSKAFPLEADVSDLELMVCKCDAMHFVKKSAVTTAVGWLEARPLRAAVPAGPNYRVVAVNDLDGDGQEDIVLALRTQNTAVGWLMNGDHSSKSQGTISSGNPGAGWVPIGLIKLRSQVMR